jgi:citrate synthase
VTPSLAMAPNGGQAGASASILVRDERSGKTTQIPIKDSTVSATGLKPLGLTVYDPGYLNTASCTSRITFIDGAKGERGLTRRS